MEVAETDMLYIIINVVESAGRKWKEYLQLILSGSKVDISDSNRCSMPSTPQGAAVLR